MDQPGKVAASPARGKLNRKNEYFPVRVELRAWEFGLARRIRQSRPASACSSLCILRLNLGCLALIIIWLPFLPDLCVLYVVVLFVYFALVLSFVSYCFSLLNPFLATMSFAGYFDAGFLLSAFFPVVLFFMCLLPAI